VTERYPDGHVLTSTVSLYILEGLSPALLKESLQVSSTPLELDSLPAQPPKPDPVPVPFVWKPPDLSHGSPWYRARVGNLLAACLCYKNPGPLMEEGLNALRLRRGNYDADGPSPTHLQLLWWMFPKEHCDELREDCSMKFLVEPRHELTPNSVMDEEIVVGEEFLNKLVSLGTLVQVTADEIVTNGPLFCLPKPGQPGRWRILSDMRRGGQNEAIGADPMVFPTGGWSAVIDASKFFYQFPTRKDEHKYLGCIHPRWADLFYVYCGLLMGAGNSPSIAGHYGAALQSLLRSHSSLFQGTPCHNTCWGVYQHGTPYNPQLGQGRTLLGSDGEPAAISKRHCNDFLVHRLTYDKTVAALTAFLDCAVDVGLLCHPCKLTPPSHVVKYTGLIFIQPLNPSCESLNIRSIRLRP
jgi:hypothetical protein